MIPPFHWWRTVFFLIPCISVYTLGLGVLSVASVLLDRSGTFAHWCARLWSWLILATTGVRVDVEGREHVRPGMPCVFVANHQSIYDIPIVFWSLPTQLRIIAKDSLGRFPVLGEHLRRTGHLLVNRRQPGPVVLKQVSRLIARGVSLVVFPEGTRSADGRVGRFRGGIFLVAIQAGVPIVPVSLSGSRHVMKKGRLMTCPGRVQLTVHPPIDTAGESPESAKALAERARLVVSAIVSADPEPAAPDSAGRRPAGPVSSLESGTR